MNRFSAQYQSTNPFLAQRAVYRYGFNGKEEDGELWSGSVTYKYRVEDARLGRFFSVDPLFSSYPWNSNTGRTSVNGSGRFTFMENAVGNSANARDFDSNRLTPSTTGITGRSPHWYNTPYNVTRVQRNQ